MFRFAIRRYLFVVAALFFFQSIGLAQEKIKYARDVRPILARHCFACHGQDEESREADLRLDDETVAKKSGAIVPGNSAKSEMISRMLAQDEDLRMPPADSNEALTAEEIETLKKWVQQGAVYEKHWSFEVPRKSKLPQVRDAAWPLTPLDHFVLKQLEQRALTPAPSADRMTWIRRVSLDLTGLPPSVEMAEQFLNDKSPEAYQKVVDRLLDSKSFGEHWARMWLDLARYADTRGYEKDRHRDIWRYRDWVIKALNEDMPYDQFTREQLAGDLLPDRTSEQILATAFHRNTMTNEEGGTDNEEFRVAAVKDRVDTTVQVWMGLTMGCAKCHSHKYDPIALEDYYAFYAFFNQTQDNDTEGPYWPTPTSEQTRKIAELNEGIKVVTKQLGEKTLEFKSEFEKWKKQFANETIWKPLKLVGFQSKQKVELKQTSEAILVAEGKRPERDTWSITFDLNGLTKLTSLRVDHFPNSSVKNSWPDTNVAIQEIRCELIDEQGKRRKIKLKNPRASFSQRGWEVHRAIDGKLNVGWAISPEYAKPQAAVFDFSEPVSGSKLVVELVQEYGQSLLLARSKFSVSHRPVTWNLPAVNDSLEKVFRDQVFEPTRNASRKMVALKKELAAIEKAIPKTPVMLELNANKRRETRIHRRGNFLDPAEKVEASVIKVFGKKDPNMSMNRLGVANWLMADTNPLTARVMVNRIWARLFGTGIVETEEDFGTQGLLPTHPELLDWLAVDFRENDWSIKKLIRKIVLSQTYRQSSATNAEKQKLDPRNRWFSRGPRFRLSAEMVRDQALSAAGLLNSKIGGPSVMPPQPNGIWKSTYNGQSWVNAKGPDRYRRAIYTYLKRTSPYPAMQTFDAGSGEVCQIRRIRTNTPLQALVVLNDQAFVEAAGGLAERMRKSSDKLPEQLANGFRFLLIRKPTANELTRLVTLYESLDLNESEQKELLNEAGLKTGNAKLVIVANVLLNLDEALTKP